MTFLDRNLLVDGVRLAYRDRGEGEPVVFVHGTPSWSYEWRHVVPAVEAAGPSRRHLRPARVRRLRAALDRDTSVAAQTDLLIGLLDELGLERPSLITYDIGGAVGQRIAVLHPQRARRLMLIDAVSYDSWPSETWREIIRTRLESYAAMSAEDFEEMLTRQLRMTVAGTMSDDDLRAYLAPHRTALGRTSFFEHQVRHFDSRYTEEHTGRLGDIAIPVRIVRGAEDRWQPVGYAERLAADIPGAELVVVPHAGHFLMEDEPERVTREVLDFLSGG